MKALNYSNTAVYRYIKKLKTIGPAGLIHGLTGKPSNNKPNYSPHILYKYVSQKRFSGFGPTLLAEKLSELFEYHIHPEILRLRMIKRGLRILYSGDKLLLYKQL